MQKDELLANAKKILEDEGKVMDEVSTEQLLNEFILPGLKNSKDVLNSIYLFGSRQRKGFFGKVKTFAQSKIINTVINVIEKPSQKQQKFNDLTYKAIEILINENNELKKKLEERVKN